MLLLLLVQHECSIGGGSEGYDVVHVTAVIGGNDFFLLKVFLDVF